MKRILGILIGTAVLGGGGWSMFREHFASLEKELLNTVPAYKEVSYKSDGTTESSTDGGTMNRNTVPEKEANTRKMRLEIPAFLTDRPEEVVWHHGFTVSFNRKTLLPNWVAWELTRSRTEGNVSRSDEFQPDPYIKKGHTADTYDYRRSGYDRGHMCPAADNKYNKKAMEECFYFSNICPQLHSLNGGDWKELEEKCRKWARKYGNIYIVCGPIITEKNPKTIGTNRVTVPNAFYKVIMRTNQKDEAKAIGYLFKHEAGNRPLKDYAVTVDRIEEITGIDFFSKMPDHLEHRMESEFNLNDWK